MFDEESDSTGDRERDAIAEIALVGDLTEGQSDVLQRLLDVPHRGRCVIYFDSPGGSSYSAISLATAIRLRGLDATAVVLGECSSAALWPFAACQRRFVTRYSNLLFHPMKWQSEEHVRLAEASEWARHFGQLEADMDAMLARLFGVPLDSILGWIDPGRYVSGSEIADAGLAELVDLVPLDLDVIMGGGEHHLAGSSDDESSKSGTRRRRRKQATPAAARRRPPLES
ncbi:MAG: ATP-dependent Clp protease proteolytic subunit [Pirellulales bacterium]